MTAAHTEGSVSRIDFMHRQPEAFTCLSEMLTEKKSWGTCLVLLPRRPGMDLDGEGLGKTDGASWSSLWKQHLKEMEPDSRRMRLNKPYCRCVATLTVELPFE